MKTGFIILLVLCWLLILMGDSKAADYMPWDTVGISTNADPDVFVPVPYGRATNYRIWSADEGLRWGWIETEETGDWRRYDSDSGWESGRVEIER